MSYCTLEEAWGEEYENQQLLNKRRKKKSKNSIYNNQGYSIYTEDQKKNQKDNRYRFEFSRGNNRLPLHNGPKKRVHLKKIKLPIENKNKNYYNGKNCFGKQMTNTDYDNMYEEELPLFNEDDEDDEEDNLVGMDTDNDIVYDNISDDEEEHLKEERMDENYENIQENNPLLNKINKLIEKIDMMVLNKEDNQPNYNDLALFIFSGILLIFIMDLFFKFGSKMK